MTPLRAWDILKNFIPIWILWNCMTVSGDVAEEPFDPFTTDDIPKFLTTGATYRAIIGDTVVLPCDAENLGRYLLLWKRGNAVLSAGDLKVSIDPRIQLLEGYKLEIRKVRIHDAGDYICQMNTLIPQDQIHTLEILVPPSVRTEPNNGHVTITKGDSVTLQCRANGNPPPSIRWTRQNNLLPNGEQSIEGHSFNVHKAGRHHAGVYICSASNGVGTPVSTSIQVKVQYPPEIEIERNLIHSGEGHEAELACIVHSDPPATVRWFRDTLILDMTDRRLVEERGARHSLIIRKVHDTDYGNYSCEADNKLGRSKRHMELTGKPTRASFQSDPKGKMRESYNITWIVESFSPITEYRLLYRKLHVHINDTKQQGKTGLEWNDVVLPATEYTYYHQGNSLTMSGVLTSLSSPMSTPNSIVHMKSYFIKNLEPETMYEAQVTAKNKFGVSQPSELFSFRTLKTDRVHSHSFVGSPQNDLFSDPEFNDMGISAASSNAHSIHWKIGQWNNMFIHNSTASYYIILVMVICFYQK